MPLHQSKKTRNKKMLATCGQTKSARIMALWDGVRTTKEIAEIVGCLPEYVRVVVRQRKGSGASESDKRYVFSAKGKSKRRSRRNRESAYNVTLHRTADLGTANKAARQARREAKRNGLSTEEANKVYWSTRLKVIWATGNKSAARKAYAKARALEAEGV